MENPYQTFVDRWTHPDYRPQPCTPDALDLAESQLSTVLPNSLRDFLEAFGPVSTNIELLDRIVDGELDLHDVSEFHNADDLVKESTAWRSLGLALDLIAFARDRMGNLFCFKSTPTRRADSDVWFFDHDFGTNESLEVSFKEWIGVFAHLPDS